MKKMPVWAILGWLLASLAALGGCAGPASPAASPSLRVAVAANAQYVAEALATEFTARTGAKVVCTVSSSGKLTAQIREGAPFDLFLSADTLYPALLHREGFTAGPPAVYAHGELVLWTLHADLSLDAAGQALLDPRVQKVAMANPRSAPFGAQAEAWLRRMNLYDQVASRLVYGESIAQVTRYLTAGACELALTTRSVVMAPELAGQGRWIALPAHTYAPIPQAAVITTYGQRHAPQAGAAFLDFLLSAEGQAMLARYGFGGAHR